MRRIGYIQATSRYGTLRCFFKIHDPWPVSLNSPAMAVRRGGEHGRIKNSVWRPDANLTVAIY